MLVELRDILVNAALLLMLAAIPLAFLVNTVMWALFKVQLKEVKISPVGEALTFVGWILALEAFISIGLAVATGTTWQQVVQLAWNNAMQWLLQKMGGGGSTRMPGTQGIIGLFRF